MLAPAAGAVWLGCFSSRRLARRRRHALRRHRLPVAVRPASARRALDGRRRGCRAGCRASAMQTLRRSPRSARGRCSASCSEVAAGSARARAYADAPPPTRQPDHSMENAQRCNSSRRNLDWDGGGMPEAPSAPENLQQTGLTLGFLNDMILRTLYIARRHARPGPGPAAVPAVQGHRGIARLPQGREVPSRCSAAT